MGALGRAVLQVAIARQGQGARLGYLGKLGILGFAVGANPPCGGFGSSP